MSLTDTIKKMLDEASSVNKEQTTVQEQTTEVVQEETTVETAQEEQTPVVSISEQIEKILATEGLSDEFKTEAVTIFEAAVADKVSQITEQLNEEYSAKFEEEKLEINKNIDGYLTEAVQTWIAQNEVAIKQNFRQQVAESFMDGLASLLREHNVVIDEESEDALEIAMNEVDGLEESLSAKEQEIASLQEEIGKLKAGKILESFKSKMAATEGDRFAQLVEGIQFKDEAQYEKQLGIVLENFSLGKKTDQQTTQMIQETTQVPVEFREVSENVASYAAFLKSGKKSII